MRPCLLLWGLLGTLWVGCVLPTPALKGQQETLRVALHEAKAQGAMACSPRELARAQMAYRFAAMEFSQGHPSRAWEHLEQGLAQVQLAKTQSEDCHVRGAEVTDSSADPWSDADGDGVGLADDNCRYVPEDQDDFEDEDGCPEPDNDGDGLLDAEDECAGEPEDFDQFEDEDGCPERDNDADGLFDAKDLCPDDPETPNGFEDDDGCPDEQPTYLVVNGSRIRFNAPLRFADGEQPTLLALSLPALKELAGLLIANGSWVVEVQGFTHNRGDPDELVAESQLRAQAVTDVLLGQGIAADRVKPVGRGSDNPVTTNRTASGREKNQRVEIGVFVPGEDGLMELGAP